jgi:tetratricopeptide (TPR) repeat protein
MAALTPDAIRIQDTWRSQTIALRNLAVEKRRDGQELALHWGPEASAEKMTLEFASAADGARWYREILQQQQLTADSHADCRHQPEGVALVRQAPEVPHVALGRVEFAGYSQWAAARGLQLRAAMLGADAIIELDRQKCREMGWGARHVSGLAVRVEDPDARKRLRLRWYAEEVGAVVNRMLLLLVVLAALLSLVSVFCAGATRLHMPTGETLPEALASTGWGMALVFAWPVVLVGLLRVLRWPQLLRVTGLAVLAATTGRGLTACLAHLLAMATAPDAPADKKALVLAVLDPVDWAFIIIGVVLFLRAWRLARDAVQILPPEAQAAPPARKAWARGLLGVTGVYALLSLGLVANARYEMSAYALQPGVDPKREQQALLALNEGAALGNKGEWAEAEQSLQRSLRLWEELTKARSAPSVYRRNMAQTLYNLGWLRDRQGREVEAEPYYTRAVALADQLAGDPAMDEPFKRCITDARQALADLRSGKSAKALDEKDRAAARKYEEAVVKAQKGEAEAEQLLGEAIALWEELLPQASSEDYRKATTAQVALAYLRLGDLQQQLGKRGPADATLQKAIDYGERAVALDPERPLFKHNLEVARGQLAVLREQIHQGEIDQLCATQHFADAVVRCWQGIKEQEDQVQSGKDRDAAVRRLAYRLDRFAWLLAHCPDEVVRDTKGAVKHARRATELQPDVGDYWYTLAMVQYRNGDWRDSLESLEKAKDKENGFTASEWLLIAMNRHQLKQRDEAKRAMRMAADWLAEQERKAEDNALIRFQLETIRPHIEALRREAERLIEGKDPANSAVG